MADVWQRFIVDVPQVEALYMVMLDIRETCAGVALKTHNPAWLQVGLQARRIQETFAADLDRIAVNMAAALNDPDKLIKAKLRAEILRPPTGNRPGLQEGIQSQAVSTGRASFGVVEVGLLDKLNEVVGEDSGEPYWMTQEFGSDHNIGRYIRGFFYNPGAGSPPNVQEGQARVHAVFVADPSGGLGEIKRPIPAKHFMRDGTRDARKQWRAEVRKAVTKAASALDRIQFPAL